MNVAFNKYKEIVSLEKHHGVQMGDYYINDTTCANFMDFTGLGLKGQLNKDLAKAKFFSLLSDGSTDSLLTEKEIIYGLYFDPSPMGSDLFEVKCSLLSLKFLKNLSSDGVHTGISYLIQKKLSLLEFYLQVID